MNIERLSELINAGGAEGVSSGFDSVLSGVTSALQTAGAAGLKDVLLPTEPHELEIPVHPGSLGEEAGFVGPLEYLRLSATTADNLGPAHPLSREALAALEEKGAAFSPLDALRGSWLDESSAGSVVEKLVGARGLLTPLTGGTDMTLALPGRSGETGKIVDLGQLGVKTREALGGLGGTGGVAPDAGPYVREVADEKAGRKLFPAEAGPYVREVADEKAGRKLFPAEAGPYVREVADERANLKLSISDAGPYVREVAQEPGSAGATREAGAAPPAGGGWPGGIDDSLQMLARMDPFTLEGVGELLRLNYQLGALDGLQQTVNGLLSLNDQLDSLRGDREV